MKVFLKYNKGSNSGFDLLVCGVVGMKGLSASSFYTLL